MKPNEKVYDVERENHDRKSEREQKKDKRVVENFSDSVYRESSARKRRSVKWNVVK